jgi:L-fuculose-phosphate aldolase
MLVGELAQQLAAAGARLAAAGLVRGSEGNLSARIDGGRCLVTPTGGVTGRLRGAELVEVAIAGERVPARASCEVHLHLMVYRSRAEVGAVVHAHPPQVLRLAGSGRVPDPDWLDGDERVFGRVLEVPRLEEGSRALARAAADALAATVACVLLGHGAVTVGPDVETALERMLLLERAAARAIGR